MITGVKLKKQYNGPLGKYVLGSLSAIFVKNVSHGLDSALTSSNSKCEETMKITLGNRIALAKPVFDRSQNVTGRAINWITWERSNGAVEMNGIELKSILKTIGEVTDINLHESESYLVPFTESQKILNRLSQLPKPKQKVPT